MRGTDYDSAINVHICRKGVSGRAGGYVNEGRVLHMDRTWLAHTNNIISSQGLIIIRSTRNTLIIRNQNKRRQNLYLVAKLKKTSINLLLGRVVTTVAPKGLAESLKDSPGKRV